MKKAFFICSLLIACQAVACNCGYDATETWEEKTTRQFYYASSIFLGKVIAIQALEKDVPAYLKDSNSPVKYTFEIIEMIKGKKTLQIVEIYSSWSDSGCGYIFEENQKYLVHTKKTVAFSSYLKEIWSENTSQCIGNTPRRRTEKNRLDLLRKLDKG